MLHLLAATFFLGILAMVMALIAASLAAAGDRILGILECRGMTPARDRISAAHSRNLCNLPRGSGAIRRRSVRAGWPAEAPLRAAA